MKDIIESEGAPAEPRIDQGLQYCLDKAKYYFRYRQDIVNRLFITLPKKFSIPHKMKVVSKDGSSYVKSVVKTFERPDKCFSIMDFVNHFAEDPDINVLKNHLVEKVANAYMQEVRVKGIAESVFDSGAMSFGTCDIISYFGNCFLTMCENKAAAAGLPLIDWGRVKIRYFVEPIEDIIEDNKAIDSKIAYKLKRVEHVPSTVIANYPAGERPRVLKIDLNKYPAPITSAIAEYFAPDGFTMEAFWVLDVSSIKDNNYKHKQDPENEPKYKGQYFLRPLAMAKIKVQKELCKVCYSSAVRGVLFDGGDDDFEAIGARYEEDDEPSGVQLIQSDKETIAANTLNDFEELQKKVKIKKAKA